MPLLHAKSRDVTSGVAGRVSESYRKRGRDWRTSLYWIGLHPLSSLQPLRKYWTL